MTRLLLAALLTALLAPAAQAETILRLSETARVIARPDELAATLRFEAEATDAAAAQSRVNAAMAKALAEAKGTAGIAVSTGGYQVWRVTQPAARWRAAQTLDLRGGDGVKILSLVGSLQGQGLAVQNLGWRLTPETARARQAEATKIALGALRTRAEEAAAVLGLKFESFREVRLDGTRAAPQPIRMRAMAAPAAMAEPVAESEDVPVEATVEAEAVLK
jgi:predicted secreted protein